MLLLTTVIAGLFVNLTENMDKQRDQHAFAQYIEGLRRTPSVDTVPEWMEADDGELDQ